MNKEKSRILWVDDEIEHLRPHIIFLKERGYDVAVASNGEDAVDMVRRGQFDLILLDEMMAGKDGLATLEEIKVIDAHVPVVMVTKCEEEELMDEAIARRITDYLTKPVNPSQVLSVCKRLLEGRRIVEGKMPEEYTSQFNRLRSLIYGPAHWRDWIEVHRILSEWDLEIDLARDADLQSVHLDQRREANVEFAKYIEAVYSRWLNDEEAPVLSVNVVAKYLYPLLTAKKQVYFIVIDCMRLDQWLTIEPIIADYYHVQRDHYYSILPTATPYSRNAIFSGLFPIEVSRRYPDLWQQARDDDQGLNRYEHQLLDQQLRRMGVHLDTRYIKVLDAKEGGRLAKTFSTSGFNSPLVAMVFNFLDILAHGRSESEILKELAPDESAFRSLMKSWFEHSDLFDILEVLSKDDCRVIITSDHGSILGTRGTKAFGKRDTSTNLRYKYGDNLRCDEKQALFIRRPEEYRLPRLTSGTTYIIAKEDFYFVYPTKYHEYLRKYQNSFQHGGISLEEMILPVVTLTPKGR